MHLIPTEAEVIEMLTRTGALRSGHFEYPSGKHADQFLQIPLAFRKYQNAKVLSVGLSRYLRADPELRAQIKDLSIVCPNTGGMPVAYGLCEALRANQVYWAEQDANTSALRLPQFTQAEPGEKVLLVDDIMRSGRHLTELRNLLERSGAVVVGIAVVVYQPTPEAPQFGSIPLFHLARLDTVHYREPENCELCRQNMPLEKIWR